MCIRDRPDIRGATTLREQLAKHRNVDSCAACHDKIDPPGFALENFDPIGGWRDNYRTMGDGQRPNFSQSPFTYAWIRYRIGLPVDATGQTEAREQFHDIREYKKLLANHDAQIAKGIPTDMNFRTGYSGRTAVFEIMELTDALQDAIHEGEPSYRIRQVAINDGMVSLEDSTRRKVLDKVTSIAELGRVITDTDRSRSVRDTAR